jgi:hypothetical protein
MAGVGGKREGAGRKPDAETQKLRALLRMRAPEAMTAVDAIIAEPGHPQHAQMVRWVVDKTAANLKPESAPVEFALTGTTPSEHARSIVEATATGKLSPTVASELLNALSACMKILEIDELQQRIEALEKAA